MDINLPPIPSEREYNVISPCNTPEKAYTQITPSLLCPYFLLTNLLFKLLFSFNVDFVQFLLILSLCTSRKPPLTLFLVNGPSNYRGIFFHCYTTWTRLDYSKLWKACSQMIKKAGITYTTSFHLESMVHPKYKATTILSQSAGAAESTSAFISLPVLEYGNYCPAGMAGQWARSEDNSAQELPPAHLPILQHTWALLPSGNSRDPRSGYFKPHSHYLF